MLQKTFRDFPPTLVFVKLQNNSGNQRADSKLKLYFPLQEEDTSDFHELPDSMQCPWFPTI